MVFTTQLIKTKLLCLQLFMHAAIRSIGNRAHNKALQTDNDLPPIKRTLFSNEKEVSDAPIQSAQEDLAIHERV